jgi:integrase
MRLMLGHEVFPEALLRDFTTHRKIGVNPLIRQRRIVREECIPRSLVKTHGKDHWITQWFMGLVDMRVERTKCIRGASMNQSLGMFHKFLRESGLLIGVTSPEELMRALAEGGQAKCVETIKLFLDSHVPRASHHAYHILLNQMFVTVLRVFPMKIDIRKRKRVYSQTEVDDSDLSDLSTASSTKGRRALKHPLTHEEESALWDAATSARDTLIVGILLTTPMRSGGLCNLQMYNVADKSDGEWIPRAIGSTLEKGCKTQEFELVSRVQTLMHIWLNRERPESNSSFVFPSGSNERGHMTTRTLRRLFKGWCILANVDPSRHNVHVTRHTRIHRMKDGGVAIDDIAKVAGHSDPRTTVQNYMQEDFATVMGRLNTDCLYHQKETKIGTPPSRSDGGTSVPTPPVTGAVVDERAQRKQQYAALMKAKQQKLMETLRDPGS